MKNSQRERLSGRTVGILPAASRRLSGAQRRRQIIETATVIFSEKGFSGATTKEIAQRSNINEALIFKHFAGKDALYDAIIEDYKDESRFAKSWRKLTAIAEMKDDLQVFIEAGKFLIERKASERDLLRVIIYGILEKRLSVAKMLEKRLFPLQEFLVKYIHERQAEKVFRQMDAQPTVDAFIGMTMHHMLTGEILCQHHSTPKDDDAISVFARITIADLLNRE